MMINDTKIIAIVVVLIIVVIGIYWMYQRSNTKSSLTQPAPSPDANYPSFPSSGAFDIYATYDPNKPSATPLISVLAPSDSGYIQSTATYRLNASSKAIPTGSTTFSTVVNSGNFSTTNPSVLPFTRLTMSQVNTMMIGGYYLINAEGTVMYHTYNAQPAVMMQISCLDIYSSSDNTILAIAVVPMSGDVIFTGIPTGSPVLDGNTNISPVGTGISINWELSPYVALQDGSAVATYIPKVDPNDASQITPILDLTVDDFQNIYILGNNGRVYWIAYAVPPAADAGDIFDARVIALDTSVTGFTSISASKQSETAAIYALKMVGSTPTLYYINGGQITWAEVTSFTLPANTIDIEIIAPIDQEDHAPPVLPAAPPPTSAVTVNATAGLGVLAATDIPTTFIRSFVAVLNTGAVAKLMPATLAWQYSNNYSSAIPMLHGQAVQVSAAYMGLSSLTVPFAAQTTLSGPLNLCIINEPTTATPLARFITFTVDVGNSSTTDTYNPNPLLQLYKSVSGDCVTNSTNDAILTASTDGQHILMYYSELQKYMTYYYYLGPTVLGTGNSIIQLVMDTSGNIFILLSNGLCYYINTTAAPVRSQSTAIVAVDSTKQLVSIAIDKSANILYGLVQTTTTSQDIYYLNAGTSMVFEPAPAGIVSFQGEYTGVTDSTEKIVSFYSNTPYDANPPIPLFSVSNYPTATADTGNVLESVAIPTRQNLMIYGQSTSYVQMYNTSSDRWMDAYGITNQSGSRVKVINLNGMSIIYSKIGGRVDYAIITGSAQSNSWSTDSLLTPGYYTLYTNTFTLNDFDTTYSIADPNVMYYVVASDQSGINIYPFSPNQSGDVMDMNGITRSVPFIHSNDQTSVRTVAADTDLNIFYKYIEADGSTQQFVYLKNVLRDGSTLTITAGEIMSNSSEIVIDLAGASPPINPVNLWSIATDKQNGILYMLVVTGTGTSASPVLYYLNGGTNMVPTLVPETSLPGINSRIPFDLTTITCGNPFYV